MVALTATGMAPVPLTEAIARIRKVQPDGEMAQVARALGICLGE
jgi:hypothetical protein